MNDVIRMFVDLLNRSPATFGFTSAGDLTFVEFLRRITTVLSSATSLITGVLLATA